MGSLYASDTYIHGYEDLNQSLCVQCTCVYFKLVYVNHLQVWGMAQNLNESNFRKLFCTTYLSPYHIPISLTENPW